MDAWRTTYAGIMPESHLAALSRKERTRRWEAGLAIATTGGHGTFVAQAPDGQIVGFAGCGPRRDGNPAYGGELYAIYVLADHQRRGSGRRLVRAVCDRLVSHGLSSALVWVLERNPHRRFYERLGGQPLGEKDWAGIPGVILREICYGWRDIQTLREACQPASGAPRL